MRPPGLPGEIFSRTDQGCHNTFARLRCLGQLSYLLPPSLRSPDQPLQTLEGGLFLVDIIKSDGNFLNNSELMQRFFRIVPPELRKTSPYPLFSFFKSEHRHTLTTLVDWVLTLEFLPALSLLVKMKELASTDLFVEVLTLSVVGRPDCGLVMPDREATNPELFFCEVRLSTISFLLEVVN